MSSDQKCLVIAILIVLAVIGASLTTGSFRDNGDAEHRLGPTAEERP